MTDLTFTGERFLPGCVGEIAYEHWHRYAFARRFVAGKRVLDAACGEGYGTALLADAATSVVGVDIDAATIAHAGTRYRHDRVRFVEGSCAALPLPDAAFDVVVSFETIEHLAERDQPAMLAEFARVLTPGGIVIVSSPNKRLYSDERQYVNEFHAHELYRDELTRLLMDSFPAQRWYHQRIATWSGIWSEGEGAEAEAWLGAADGVTPYAIGDGMYFVVVAARSTATLPSPEPRVSLLSDALDSEGKRATANAGEVLRLDALLTTATAALDRHAAHVSHLETLIAERDARLDVVTSEFAAEKRRYAAETAAESDRVAQMVGAFKAEIARLHALEQGLERAVSYRQSFRWWLALPWMRLRLWLDGRR